MIFLIEAEARMKYDKFLLFGDSITEFAFAPEQFTLGSALCNIYTRKLDIVQRGYAGYTSRWAVPILKDIIVDNEPRTDIVMGMIAFGANDTVEMGPQKVPLNEYIENITEMVNIMRNANILPIVVGPALVDRSKWDILKVDDIKEGWVRDNSYMKQYSDALVKLTEELNVPYVNLHRIFLRTAKDNNADWQNYLLDGLHFNGAGYKIFYEELLKQIGLWYPQYSPENIPIKLTNWRQVDENGSNLNL